MQDCPDSARVVVADQLARSTLLADNLRVKSKVHPKYKTKYHVGNWPEYEQALVRRGDVTLWLSAEAMDAAVSGVRLALFRARERLDGTLVECRPQALSIAP